ncbi:Flagellar basal-body rod protein FlgC [Candidatus Bealeia paramacronuclearis]|uniref:Flagellar basal-body rod protein FlgC n=1 Tax=Candidatus Bealeia paramacronuclearis TaxID=1921001 RepID=A0ABZ2C174_9PROT|nr:Flagellar basal-body rod protein FlgC [Candidatus Bealeia paramacronuclearis]
MSNPVSGPLNRALHGLSYGMSNDQRRMEIATENFINANTTASQPGGDPYRRKITSYTAQFDPNAGKKVYHLKEQRDSSEFLTEYDPTHPAADTNGMVKKPNINPMMESVDFQKAGVDHQAKVEAYKTISRTLHNTIGLMDPNR